MADRLDRASSAVAPDRASWQRLAVFGLLGFALLWLVLTRSLPTSLAGTAPEFALVLQPNEPRILLNRARADAETLLASLATKSTPKSRSSSASSPTAPPSPESGGLSTDRLIGMARVAERLLPADERPTGGGEPPLSKSVKSSDANQKAESPSSSDGVISTPDAASVRDLARRSISAAPFNAGSLTVLGQLAELEGDRNRAAPFMQAAARLSIRESYAVYWLLQQEQAAGEQAAVIGKADTLLRTRGRSVPLVVPVLAQLVEKNKATSEVAALLASNPPWRASFFAALPQSITDARTPLYLLLGLQGTAHPPSEREISSYLDFLMAKNFPELAYYAWLQFLPPDKFARLSPLNNGTFEAQPTGVPFDWTLPQGGGFTAEIRSIPNQEIGHALFIEFTQGRAEFAGVTQATVMGPGTYTLSGKMKGTLVGARGLVWRVNCFGKGPIAATDLLQGDSSEWRDFSLSVTIPPEGCRIQQIRLDLDARSASEKLVTGSMWFDDVKISRGRSSDPTAQPTPEL